MTKDDSNDLIRRLTDALESWLQAHELGGIPPQDGADAALVIEARAYLGKKAGMIRKAERPDRLIAGDVWEFEADRPVKGKGKGKLQTVKLQWEVIAYHFGEQAWQLKSLDGKHFIYLWEHAPQYEEMEYIGTLQENND